METDTPATQSWVIDTLRRALEAMQRRPVAEADRPEGRGGQYGTQSVILYDLDTALGSLPPREPAPACTTFYDRNWYDEPVLCDTPGVMEVPSYHHCPDSICANPNGCGKRRDEHPPHVKPAPKPAGLPEVKAVAWWWRKRDGSDSDWINKVVASNPNYRDPSADRVPLVPESTARAYEAALAIERGRVEGADAMAQHYKARAEKAERELAAAEARGRAAGFAEAREQAAALLRLHADDCEKCCVNCGKVSKHYRDAAERVSAMQPKAVNG